MARTFPLTLLVVGCAEAAPSPRSTACAEDGWVGEAPDWYVAPGGAGAGTSEAPFPTVSAAVSAAGDGDTIAIDEGTYDEALALDRPVRLVGRCAEVVRLTGEHGQATTTVRAAGVHLAGLALSGGTIAGLMVTGEGAEATLDQAVVTENLGVGVWVEDGGTLTATDVDVSQNLVLEGFPTAVGVYVHNASTLTLTRARVAENPGWGVLCTGARAHLEDVEILDTQPDPGGGHAIGVELREGCEGTFGGGVIVDRSALAGVALDDATLVATGANEVRRTRDAPFSTGLGVYGDSEVTLGDGFLIRDNDGWAVHMEADQVGPRLHLDGVTLRGNCLGGFASESIWANGATVELTRSVIEDAPCGGLHAHGTDLTLTDVELRNLRGIGVAHLDGAITLDQVDVSGVTEDRANDLPGWGVILEGASQLSGAGLRIAQTDDYGLLAVSSTVDLDGLTVEDAHGAGVLLVGTTGGIDGLDVSGTRAAAQRDWGGYGVAVTTRLVLTEGEETFPPPDDAGLELRQADLTDNEGAGVLIAEAPAVRFEGRVAQTRAGAGGGGEGLVAIGSEPVEVVDTTFEGNLGVSLLYDAGSGSITGTASADAVGLIQQGCTDQVPVDVDATSTLGTVHLCDGVEAAVGWSTPATSNDVGAD